jgi:hypothetical protein
MSGAGQTDDKHPHWRDEMSDFEKDEKSTDVPDSEGGLSPDMVRRDFIKRFGVYSAGACAGLLVLMSARTSKAVGNSGDDGGPD